MSNLSTNYRRPLWFDEEDTPGASVLSTNYGQELSPAEEMEKLRVAALALVPRWQLLAHLQRPDESDDTSVRFAVDAGPADRLREMSALEDSWMGEGSLAPLSDTLANARAICESFMTVLPSPELAPNENGTITLEWQTRFGFAILEVGATRFALAVKRPGVGGRYKNGDLRTVPYRLAYTIESELYEPADSVSASTA